MADRVISCFPLNPLFSGIRRRLFVEFVCINGFICGEQLAGLIKQQTHTHTHL